MSTVSSCVKCKSTHIKENMGKTNYKNINVPDLDNPCFPLSVSGGMEFYFLSLSLFY